MVKKNIPNVETWKIGLYFVVRDNNGRFVSTKKKEKGETLYNERRIFNKNKTLRSDTKKVIYASGIVQNTIKSKSLPKRFRNQEKVQYYVRAIVNGREIVARSRFKNNSDERNNMKGAAYQRFYAQVADQENKGYDVDVGRGLVLKKKVRIQHLEEGYIVYK